jgi:hypothetical protein
MRSSATHEPVPVLLARVVSFTAAMGVVLLIASVASVAGRGRELETPTSGGGAAGTSASLFVESARPIAGGADGREA